MLILFIDDMSTKNSSTWLSQLWLSFLTPTVMIGQMSTEKLIDLLEDMGKSSEELFRGERLPLLKDHYLDS